jgi:glycosyltransferase involved in cell wall biosynthesis
MATALPVVAYDTRVSREYLGSHGIYAEPIGDVEGLTEALAFALRNPVVGRLLGDMLRERAGRHFSWHRTGRQLLRVYNRVWTT